MRMLPVGRRLGIWRDWIILLGICACACVHPASASVFYRPPAGNRPPQISIKGDLVQKDLETFAAVAETARRAAAIDGPSGKNRASAVAGNVNVTLDSRGGNIWAAMSMGRIIRSHSFTTRVEVGASCVSACVYLLAAGNGRYVGGRIGVHRPYIPNDGVTSARSKKAQYDGINAQTRQYLEDMDLPTALHDRMMRTPPDQIAWLSPQELSTYGLMRMSPPQARRGTH